MKLMSDTKLRKTRMDPEGRIYATPEEQEMREFRDWLKGLVVAVAVSIPVAVLASLLAIWLLTRLSGRL